MNNHKYLSLYLTNVFGNNPGVLIYFWSQYVKSQAVSKRFACYNLIVHLKGNNSSGNCVQENLEERFMTQILLTKQEVGCLDFNNGNMESGSCTL